MSLQIHDFMLTTKYLRKPLARNLYFQKNQSCKNLCTTISEKQGVHMSVSILHVAFHLAGKNLFPEKSAAKCPRNRGRCHRKHSLQSTAPATTTRVPHSQSAALATKSDIVNHANPSTLRLPRKVLTKHATSAKYCACHAKHTWTSPEILMPLLLPLLSSAREAKGRRTKNMVPRW